MSVASFIAGATKAFLKYGTRFVMLFPKLFIWLAPFLKYIPAPFVFFFNLIIKHVKIVALLFFCMAIFTPVMTSYEMDASMEEKLFTFVNAVGESIAQPDKALVDNIAILREAQTNTEIKMLVPYIQVVRAVMEFGMIFLIGMIGVGLLFSNTSAIKTFAAFTIVAIVVGLCEINYTQTFPFSGVLFSESSILNNIMLLINPIEPMYEGYEYMRTRFTTFDIFM